MIVVADTSPVNYLLQIELIELLPALYGRIILPEAVVSELSDSKAPPVVRRWSLTLPSWVELRRSPPREHPELGALDPGERAAIETALELSATVLLIDEFKARSIATRVFGLTVTGTLGILRDAHKAGLENGVRAYGSLCERTNFYRNEQLEKIFLASLL